MATRRHEFWWLGPLPRLRWDWAWAFIGSTLVVVLGVMLGREYIPEGSRLVANGRSTADALVPSERMHSRGIETEGSLRRSVPAPAHSPSAYAMAVRGVQSIVGGPVERAAVLVSHASLLFAFLWLAVYTDSRHGARSPNARSGALIAAGFFPASLFFHLGSSESLFLLICLIGLGLIEGAKSPVWIACLFAIGLSMRLAGLALILPALIYAWQYGRGGWRSAGWVVLCLLLMLAGFLGYRDSTTGEPVVFGQGWAQPWPLLEPRSLGSEVVALLTLRPVWGGFDSTSSLHWGRFCASSVEAFFSIDAVGSVGFLLALVLTGWGAWKRILNRYEVAMAAGLLAIPYWVGGDNISMVSMARHVSVVAPIYPVAGVLLARCSPVGVAGIAGLLATLMTFYAARVASDRWIF